MYKSITTVIIIDSNYDEPSTVSFESFNEAIDYVIGELEGTDGFDIETKDEVIEELEDQMFYKFKNVKYYLESASLVTRKQK